ncbi:hypothetical protein [Roseibium sp. RKSG952]|uniref:hypothetical protein n=1 Tax=Roseibium sp. RKSG952 TaxID=2529384 RepID=UPI0012BCD9A4|nr:hypothetical protein [Roseibium sp. RKSG952]MTH99605.1 hypothetical protein [Roseibium sp. RKSG952]
MTQPKNRPSGATGDLAACTTLQAAQGGFLHYPQYSFLRCKKSEQRVKEACRWLAGFGSATLLFKQRQAELWLENNLRYRF